MAELQPKTQLLEFTIAQKPRDIVEKILAHEPKIVGFGVYIWNTLETQEVVSILKRVRPDILVVLGGPEVSYEAEGQAIVATADYVIQGESDLLFPEFCRKVFSQMPAPDHKIIKAQLPEITEIKSPYSYYTENDIKNRVIYVEASRGCPYKCEYCLSSLDKSVRNIPLDSFLKDMQSLIDRGARQFKFVDRTFNLSPNISTKILTFFLDQIDLGLFLHFEMVPDRLPEELRVLIKKFPAGSLQFEIGIQTWNPLVSALVSRRQDYKKIAENFHFLKNETKVHTHADLIVGLPGESLESFGQGFDALAALQPDEVQVGILKRLKGTPIIRHDHEWQMVYQEHPPFQVLSTKTMNFSTLQQMNRFSKFWDLFANSGNFLNTMELFKSEAAKSERGSLFWFFAEFSEYLSTRHPAGHGIALLNLVESIWLYLTLELHLDAEKCREALVQDYALGSKKRDVPKFLLNPDDARVEIVRPKVKALIPQGVATPARQQKRVLRAETNLIN